MKIVHLLRGLAFAVALASCAQKDDDIPVPAPDPTAAGVVRQSTIALPNVSATIWIRQRVALPPDAVLTVTLSDASRVDAPSKVLAQQVIRTGGKQPPFSFTLPLNPADIQPGARILLSAAIAIDGKLVYITKTVKPVINQGGSKADLTLMQVQQTAVMMQPGGGAATTVPSTSPTQITPSSAIPAPTSIP